jgi:hypothetical protein
VEQILDRLWLGDATDTAVFQQAPDPDEPRWAILTLCEASPIIHEAFTHIHAPIPDEAYLPREVWSELLHSLFGLLISHDNVLVHCRLGVSRSPALVAAYLARCGHSRSPDHGLTYVCSKRGVCQPHVETWRGVLDWYARYHAM